MSQNTPYNLYIAVLLRGRTTFCNFPFARYGFWAILGVLGLIWARKLGFRSQKKLAPKLILFLEASVSDFNRENKINKKWTRDLFKVHNSPDYSVGAPRTHYCIIIRSASRRNYCAHKTLCTHFEHSAQKICPYMGNDRFL